MIIVINQRASAWNAAVFNTKLTAEAADNCKLGQIDRVSPLKFRPLGALFALFPKFLRKLTDLPSFVLFSHSSGLSGTTFFGSRA